MLNNLVAFCQCPAGRRLAASPVGRAKSGTHSGTILPRVTVGARAGHTGSRDTFLALRFALHAKGEELVKLGIIFRGKTQLYTTRTKGEETAAGRLSAAGSVNRTEHRSSGSLQRSAFVHCRRTGTFRSVRLQTVTAKIANRIAPWCLAGPVAGQLNQCTKEILCHHPHPTPSPKHIPPFPCSNIRGVIHFV